ncbi:hypothetical protein [Paenibacillus abyssi]|uniref:Uncharacterized protein n=1 Tax=Paenibacillus abyssi TaxID=1340531 RepID=A0A917CZN5_9BACL|nr:hypothetical protein [Paenibacillus abyssi]GGG03799.1 hypothetical protein GCM10010916_21100 [Paenibacillus abyssi]
MPRKMRAELEDGRRILEAELKTNRGEAEIKIHAAAGQILSVDIDEDDDGFVADTGINSLTRFVLLLIGIGL